MVMEIDSNSVCSKTKQLFLLCGFHKALQHAVIYRQMGKIKGASVVDLD